MKSGVVPGFAVGVVAGAVLTLLLLGGIAPGLMIREYASPYDLEETVGRITGSAEASGWVVSSVAELDASIRKHGGPDVLPVRLVNLCRAEYAGAILQDDEARLVSVMMPCTIAAYEKSDGRTYVSALNAGLVGRLFGGVVGEMMGGPVAADQKEFLAFVHP